MKDRKIMAEFPEFFGAGTVYGFECGEGWFDILRTMLERLREKLSKYPNVKLTFRQIKSKFGDLRAYYDLSEDADRVIVNEIRDVIDFFGDRCASTCEVCGAPGIQSTISGWVRVSCPWHELLDRREEQKQLIAEIDRLRAEPSCG